MRGFKKKIIIIGGGTSGLAIANRLQDLFEVIVIEKSVYRKYAWIYRIPLMIGVLFRKIVPKHITRREFRLRDGRKIPFYESNLLGGASVMNGAVHVFGFESVWKKTLSRFGIDYDDLLESNRDIYSFNLKEKNKMSLMLAPQNIIDKAFIETLNSKNIRNGDMGYAENEVCGPIQNTARTYFRTSVLTLLNKLDFKICLNEKVVGILFDENKKVKGVQTNKRIIDSDYIVLSAGVIGSCDLMLREQARGSLTDKLNIGMIQDHTNIRINVLATKKIDSLNEVYDSWLKKAKLAIKHFLGIPTVMRGTGATSAAYLDLDHDGQIDTRIQILQFAETTRHGHGNNGYLFGSNKPSFSISINAIHPESKGTILLDDKDNTVDPNFLSVGKDIEILKLALAYCMDLLKSNPIKNYVLEIIDENMIINEPEKFIRNTMYSGHHLIGGLHEAVDENFQVIGTNGLYVCDASVFDRFVASNIHSSVVLLADLFAKKFIKNVE